MAKKKNKAARKAAVRGRLLGQIRSVGQRLAGQIQGVGQKPVAQQPSVEPDEFFIRPASKETST